MADLRCTKKEHCPDPDACTRQGDCLKVVRASPAPQPESAAQAGATPSQTACQVCLARERAVRDELATAIERERLANMRADQAEEARDAENTAPNLRKSSVADALKGGHDAAGQAAGNRSGDSGLTGGAPAPAAPGRSHGSTEKHSEATPRTDAVYDSLHGCGLVKVEFARQLERELAVMHAVCEGAAITALSAVSASVPTTITEAMISAAKKAESKVGRDAIVRIYQAMRAVDGPAKREGQ